MHFNLPNFKKEENIYWLVLFFCFFLAVMIISVENGRLDEETNRPYNYGFFSKKEMVAGFAVPVRLTIDYGNGRKRAFEGDTFEGMNLTDVFKGVENVSGIIFSVQGVRLISVDGVRDGLGEKHWNYYLNGVKQSGNPLAKIVRAGDKVTVKYE